jgi:LPS-assembly lipoprotein
MSSFKFIPVFVALLVLTGCGFRPLYGGGGGSASPEFARIKVEAIPDRIGQLLHNQLLTALNPKSRPRKPGYVLTTRLVQSSTSLAVRKSAFATRANLQVTANFQLVRTLDGKTLYSGKSEITVSYNILDSEYATLSVKKDAQFRAVREISQGIRTQLGVYFSRARTHKN